MISPAQEVKVGEVFLLTGRDGINLSVHAYILFHELGMLRDKLETDDNHCSHSHHLPMLLLQWNRVSIIQLDRGLVRLLMEGVLLSSTHASGKGSPLVHAHWQEGFSRGVWGDNDLQPGQGYSPRDCLTMCPICRGIRHSD